MAELQGRLVNRSTRNAGQEVLTITSNIASGSDQDCRRVLFWSVSGNSDMYFNIGAEANTGDVLLLEGVIYELYLTNTNLLNFYGTNGDKVYLIWEN